MTVRPRSKPFTELRAQPAAGRRYALVAVGLVAVLLAAGGAVFASTAPDGIEQIAIQTGIAAQAHTLNRPPSRTTRLPGWASAPAQAGADLAGLALVGGICVLIGRKGRPR